MTDNDKWGHGWQKAADYIHMHKRTVMRYEKKYRFPVRRGPNGRVKWKYSEVDAWLDNFFHR